MFTSNGLKVVMCKLKLVILLLFISVVSSLYEGDNCTLDDSGENGLCLSIAECSHAKNLLSYNKRPQHCGFNRDYPLVCCPSRAGTKSDKKCSEYHNLRYNVFGLFLGENAKPREFRHMSAIGFNKDGQTLWLCGGSLISPNFVLSAAHCAQSREFGPATLVRVGELDLKNTTEDAKPEDYKILQVFVHPSYKAPSHYHDIALFKLESEVSFGLFYMPACLHIEGNLPSELQATGWGKTDYLGETSSHLLKVNLQLIEYDKCAKSYSNVSPRKLSQGILDNLQICAGDVSGKDTCPGDSGGPLHYRVKRIDPVLSHFVLAGITSFGKGCGISNSVGVYTRVSAYVDWIENIVWP